MECFTTKTIAVRDIRVLQRIRKGALEIEELAEDIRARGLINPITVMEDEQHRFTLIAGLRRLEACRKNGVEDIRATIVSPMDADALLKMEFAENEQRQDFTMSERLDYAAKIKAIEEAKARERKSFFSQIKGEVDMDDRPYPEKTTTRDAIAKQVGIGSGRQYERAAKIASKRPDLMEKVDAGEMSIHKAYAETVSVDPQEEIAELPEAEQAPSKPLVPDPITRARHERLMKNSVYAELYQKHKEAVEEANIARCQLAFQVEGYEKRVRAYEENADYMRRKISKLESENAKLRAQLDTLNAANNTNDN